MSSTHPGAAAENLADWKDERPGLPSVSFVVEEERWEASANAGMSGQCLRTQFKLLSRPRSVIPTSVCKCGWPGGR